MPTSKRSYESNATQPAWTRVLKVLAVNAFVLLILTVVFGVLVAASTPAGAAARSFLVWLLAGDTPQMTWYITRAAGITAYLLLWLSTFWGLALSSRIFDGLLHGASTYDFHEFLSLLSLAFTGLHITVLLVDQYAPFSLAQILVPFLSTYRPGWVGVGILSLYISLLVTVTFTMRSQIGAKAFRTIHIFSLAGFAGSAVHGLMAGTDSPLPVVQLMYAFTFLTVVFMTTYWAAALLWKKHSANAYQRAGQP